MFDTASYGESFERDTGCTEAEWLGWLPGACGGHGLSLGPGPGQAQVRLGAGVLHLRWQVLAPRQIALVRLPRLWVVYRFEGVEAPERIAFMKRFDLHMQRGGG
ncbi:hypothetical protein [Ideonella livida]|uniref:Uncharacterized protein n=1 Tax=Ideonella livida TaxID=2707176 RepID=A0A7C9TKH1_9BURK|nr:hypothetical protein [Ideonella livida]NDY91744.1 hypothetical protein [Ideonella livida]